MFFYLPIGNCLKTEEKNKKIKTKTWLTSAFPGLFTNPVVGVGAVLVEPDAAGLHGATAVLVPVAVLAPSVPKAGERRKEEREEKKKKRTKRGKGRKRKNKKSAAVAELSQEKGKFLFQGKESAEKLHPAPQKIGFVLCCFATSKKKCSHNSIFPV